VTLALAVCVGALVAAGVYLLLRRSLVKIVLGIALLGHGVNLLIFAAGRAERASAPVVPEGAETLAPPYADPVPQALVLTAIVIGFAIQAFALVLFKRAYAVTGTDDVDAMDATER
jgi:multicomponent Na+:H+ antiporter subunit C